MSSPAGDAEAVPVDLSGWSVGGDAVRDAIAAAVDRACSSSGFLALTGHGVDPTVMEQVLEVSTAFFDLPLETKRRVMVDDKVANRGYAAFGTEALAYSRGIESEPDMFEAFNIGCETVPAGVSAVARAQFFAPNVWPDEPVGLRSTYLEYFAECAQLSRTLCQVFARALGLEEHFFVDVHDRAPSVMRANNYERRPEHPEPSPDQLRMGAHSDYGSFTILMADPVPGLQILGTRGEWHDVLPPAGGFLVNLGDLLAEWTNDRWRSTVHRVVPPPQGTIGPFRRRSIAWFQQPNHDAVIEVLDVCCDDDNPPRYPPTTSGDHLLAKLMGPRSGAVSDVDATFLGLGD